MYTALIFLHFFYSFLMFSLPFMNIQIDHLDIQPASTTAMSLNKFDTKFSVLG